MFKVISWDTNATLARFETLAAARKHCRALGTLPNTLLPVAFVRDSEGFCVYNPRYKQPTASTVK